MNETLNIRLASRGMYESNSTDGVWLQLPATAEQLDGALARIGAPGGEHGMDYFITAVESSIPALSRLPLENLRRAGIDELNYIAGQFEKIEPAQLDKLSAAIDVIAKSGEIHRLAEYSGNTEYFEHLPEVLGYAQLGKHYLDSGRVDMPDEWKGAVDVSKLGQLAAAHEQGIFTSQGYIRPTGDIWETMKELPEEYEIEPKPEKQQRKPERAMSGRMYDTVAAYAAPAATRAAPIAAAPFVLASETTFDKLKEITGKLEHGLKGIFGSDQYKNYLQIVSKFHTYSSRNCMLIAMQKPNATFLAGYNTWRDDLKRHVIKGEKGIKILAPDSYKTTRDVAKTTADGKPVIGANGQQVTERVEVKMPSFKVVSIYDVSQTYGEPLPTLGKSELAGSVDNYKDFFAALEKASPVPVAFEAMGDGHNGYYDQTEKRIAINEGMSELQTLKTLIHETAHSRLHDIDQKATGDAPPPDRRTREVEAEGIAYAVCQHYGLDTSDYSFGYIAAWSGDKQIDALKESLHTIRKEANEIIKEVDRHMNDLQKDRQQTKTQDVEETAQPAADAPKQHYSTAVQMAVDTSGKAEPPATAPAASVKPSEPAPAPKPPAQGENVAAIEAKVNAGETINLSDLSDAIKKDKQATQSAQSGKPDKAAAKVPAKTSAQMKTQAKGKTTAKKPAAPEKPSIREELAASKKQAAARKPAPSKSKNNALEV